jgi:hypothetical protein
LRSFNVIKRIDGAHEALAQKLYQEVERVCVRINGLKGSVPGSTIFVPEILTRVDQIDKRLKCATDGHLDPVCPRCNEPLVLAEPPHVTDMGDKPRRRARAIHETKPDIDNLPTGKVVEGVA